MRQKQRYFILLGVLATTLIMYPVRADVILFEEDFSSHKVGFHMNSANGWSQLWSTEKVKIGSGDPDFTGNYADGTDRYGIFSDASHYHEAGIGSEGMDPDLEYRFSFTWKMGPNTHGGGLGFHNSGSAHSGVPAIYGYQSHHDGSRMLFHGGDNEQVGFAQPEPGAIVDVELVINSTDNYAVVNGVEGNPKGTPPGLMESLDGIFYWHPAKIDNRDGGLVDDIVVSIIDMALTIPGDANDDGVVAASEKGEASSFQGPGWLSPGWMCPSPPHSIGLKFQVGLFGNGSSRLPVMGARSPGSVSRKTGTGGPAKTEPNVKPKVTMASMHVYRRI